MRNEILEKTKDVLFDTSLQPIFIERPEFFESVPNTFGVQREDTGQILGIVSERYQPLNNMQIIQHVDEILAKAKIKYDIARTMSHNGGVKTGIEYRFPDKTINIGDDKNELRLYMKNSFDAKSAVKMDGGFFRLICSNGMVVGKVEKTFSINHYREVDKKTVENFVGYIDEKYKEAQELVYNLDSTDFESKDQVEDYILSADVIAKKYRPMVLMTWVNKYQASIGAWMVLNAYTEVITHDMEVNEFSKLNALRSLNNTTHKWLEGDFAY
jgi:hypothetical protein